MNENRYTKLLESHGVNPTANRIVVAKALAASYRPMSLAELENKILTIDKSGISRALTLFKEHHLVHVIEDGSDAVRYELCHSHDDHHEDNDMHVHFYCERCNRTFCIDNTPIPEIELPEGYMMTSANFVVKGICPECK
ncbi:MAG: transcriptional repressor [Prevotella sp.]|nr:transcriptional repressor [Prevotella sp.]